MGNVFALTQRAYRWYNDDGSESASTPAAAENTQLTVSPNGTTDYHLRIGLGETGAGSISGATTDDYQLQYSYNGGAYTNVTAASSVVRGLASAHLTDAGTTTNRATNGISDGSGAFVAGEISEVGLITDRQITANNFTEFLYALRFIAADTTNGHAINFRVLLNGATTNMAYSVTPSVLIDKVNELTANDVSSASSVTAPAIVQVHILNAADVASASSVTVPALGQVHVLNANDVSSASSVTAPALSDVADTVNELLANDVSSASSVSVPAVGQFHVLNANGLASASGVSAAALGQVHVLAANDVSAASSASAPTLSSGAYVILANSVSSASSVSAPSLQVVVNQVARAGGGVIRFSRKDWREWRKARNARREAERAAADKKKTARVALVAAAKKAGEALEASKSDPRFNELARQLWAAAEAKRAAETIAAARRVSALAKLIIASSKNVNDANEEEEAIVLFLAA